MTPRQPREPLQQQIYRAMAAALQTRLEGQELSWPAVHAAEGRMRARVRLTVGRRLEVPDTHPGMAHALSALAQDAPEQAAHDAALVSRWRQARGIVADAGARDWVLARLEEMSRRQQAAGAHDGW